jgi:hypothetical protein
MANALYNEGKRALLNKELDLDTDTLTVALVKNTYTFSQAHTDVSVSIASHIASSTTLTGVTIAADGTVDANHPNFTAVTAGDTISAVVIYKGTTPIVYLDTGTGFPFATTGGDVEISWSVSGIFRL